VKPPSQPPFRWRSQALAQAVEDIETGMDEAWTTLLGERIVEPGSPEETNLAWLVADHPAGHDWRVVDAALDRLRCRDCGCELTRGPLTCRTCTHYHGLRFAARESDRPHVQAGNEHAVRVACAVARARARYSAHTRVSYELVLPDLLAGMVPTAAEAQAAGALINKLTPEECDQVASLADIEIQVRGR
jgi:ribosomal protein L40E